MKWMQETTEWEDGSDCNHLYLLDGDKCVAYVAAGTNQHKVFKSPLRFDLRHRTFKFVQDYTPGTRANIKTYTGSKGATYTVDLDEQTCTCPGFTFRGACKHVAELQHAG